MNIFNLLCGEQAARRHAEIVGLINQLRKDIMTATSDLQASVTDLKSAVVSVVTALDDLAAKVAAASNDPAVQQAASDIKDQANALRAAVTKDDPA